MNRRLLRLSIAAATLLSIGLQPAVAVEKNTGSAHPYLGYTRVGPFILKRPDSTMVLEVAVRFKPDVEALVQSTIMDKAAKDVLRMRLYEAAMSSFLEFGRRLDRKELRGRLMREVDRLLTFDGTEDIIFTRIEFR